MWQHAGGAASFNAVPFIGAVEHATRRYKTIDGPPPCPAEHLECGTALCNLTSPDPSSLKRLP
eukprot:3952110-Prymnesium_polylepis.1